MPIRPEYGELVRELTDGRNHRQIAIAAGIDPANIVRARAGHVGRPSTVAAIADGLELRDARRAQYFKTAGIRDPGPRPASSAAAFMPRYTGLSYRWQAAMDLNVLAGHIVHGIWMVHPMSSETYRRAIEAHLVKIVDHYQEQGVAIPDFMELMRSSRTQCLTEEDAADHAALVEAVLPFVLRGAKKGQPEPD